MNAAFLHEAEGYGLLGRAGWAVPRHGWLGGALPFAAGEAVVLKGLGEELWHKSELGAVRFAEFDPAALAEDAAGMRRRIETAGHRWLGALVVERVASAPAEGVPAEAFVSLARREAGWLALVGCGGLAADALADQVPPLRWPLGLMTPAAACAELEPHLLGRVWLGTLRGARPRTSRRDLEQWVASLWTLADLAEREGIALLELNPVVMAEDGRPRALDAVGRRGSPPISRCPPPEGWLDALLRPGRVAVAGVSAHPDGIGRTILDKLRRCSALTDRLVVIKPGVGEVHGVPCVPDVAALRAHPADLLLLALPAAVSAKLVADLLAQGGGARVVGLVAGGLGDGADPAGLGAEIAAQLHAARAAGRWTPAVLGPNFFGHWVPECALDTTFIPPERLPAPTEPGAVALLAQSGACLICRRSRNLRLRLRLGLSLGNELDVALPEALAALADDPDCRAVAAYVEGFAPGQLAATVEAARRLRARGVPIVLLRAGRTAEGRAAAASHTGAMAGDLVVEREFLARVGVRFAPSFAAFDAALAWLGVYPEIRPGPVAFITNAGLEAVNASDLAGGRWPLAHLSEEGRLALGRLFAAEQLTGVAVPRVPLDLTPMARVEVFLQAAELLLQGEAAVLLMGLVPFARHVALGADELAAVAGRTAALARAAGKPAAFVVDAGAEYEAFRAALATAGLPVFARVEDAMAGLHVLA